MTVLDDKTNTASELGNGEDNHDTKATKRTATYERLQRQGVTTLLVATVFVVLVAIWQLLSSSGFVPQYLLPTPAETAQSIWTDGTSARFWTDDFLATLTVVVIGFIIAAIAGMVIGPLITIHPLIERGLYPYVVAFQTLPKIALAPLLLVWLGYGNTSKFMIAALVAFFPVVVNVIAGLKAGDQRQLTLMRSLRANWWTRMRKVRIPNALPYAFAGLDIAIVFSVIGAIVAEFLGSPNGLGSLVIIRQTNVEIAGLFSVLFYLALMGYLLHLIIAVLEKRFTFWAKNTDTTPN